MTTHESQTLWLNRVKEELENMAPAEWVIRIYAYRFGKGAEPDQPKFIPISIADDKVDRSEPAVVKVAEMAAYFHFTVIVDPKVAEPDLGSTAVGSDAKKRSIYAVPVFRPDVYDPSPIMRPLLSVICFASDLSTEQILQNYRLHVFAEKFAEITVDELINMKIPFPFEKLAWEDIREDILTRLASEFFKPMKLLNQTRDSSGTTWCEFKPGCFARETDIHKLMWFQERFLVTGKIDRWVSSTEISVLGRIDRWLSSTEISALKPAKPAGAVDIKRYIDTGDFAGLYKEIDSLTDTQLKAFTYRKVAMICVDRDDKFNSFIAANANREVLGQTPEAYLFLGYIYWWFEEIDTAIVYSEKALQVALNLPEYEGNKDRNIIYEIKNDLAFYYAEKQINKDTAFSYITEILDKISPQDKYYWRYLDTIGYVYLKFATKKEDVDEAIKHFLTVLEIEPQSKDTQQHLIEAFEKKGNLRHGSYGKTK